MGTEKISFRTRRGIGQTSRRNSGTIGNGSSKTGLPRSAQLEKHLELSDEERSGVLLSGDKLALAVTPHFFNLLPANESG